VNALLSIAERSLGFVAGTASAGLRAAGQIVTAVRGGDPGGAAPEPKSQLTDAALAHKVESELFRDGSVPKGNIDVNAVGRVVYLRGKARSATMVADLTVRTQAIPEVERVENLLQAPRPRRSKAGATKRGSSTPRRRPSRRVNAEAPPTAPEAEPSPRELAAKGKGRRAAPLGSTQSEANEVEKPSTRRAKGAAAKRGSSRRQPSRRVNAEVPSSDPKAEPAPKELAAKGEGRRAAPLGGSDSGKGAGADTTAAAPKPDEDVGS
jgi:hypothetical protein